MITVNNYSNLAKSILKIAEKNFDLAKEILEEKLIISLHNTIALADYSEYELDKLMRLVDKENKSIKYFDIIQNHDKNTKQNKSQKANKQEEPEIRKIPKYDPDVELAGLIFTLPSWLNSINRIYEVDLKKVSNKTKKDLYERMLQLNRATENLMRELENNK